ncbi:plakophilin-1 [Notothenia coriiceps]|uniref:Plakophilin-1 n=1 Tax=Notothenia coriiceps TaxID=8208 RepID=A0A6I9MT35_9TELE|nr:PREDICTED: plakophilin-1 [Notothenia coriiceps]
MMAPEPLRSAMSIRCVEDTSLAVPSDTKLHSGQRRVLDQVHTIKRSKSKPGKSGTLSPPALSPLPQNMSTCEFGTFKFSPSKANGFFGRANSSQSTGYTKVGHTTKSRTLSAKTSKGQHYSSSGWEQNNFATLSPNGLRSARSDPALARTLGAAHTGGTVMRAKGQAVQNNIMQNRVNRQSAYSTTSNHQMNSNPQTTSNYQTTSNHQMNSNPQMNGNYQTTSNHQMNSNYQTNSNPQMNSNHQMTNSQTHIVQQPSMHSMTDGKMGTIKRSNIEQISAVNSSVNMSDMTLKQAIEFLSQSDENYQQCGATFIQHTTYKEESTKQEVFKMGGIPALVTLLRSANPGVSQAAAGALRNLVFKDQANKLQVQHCGGIAKALQLLKESDSTETQKQIAGLLWNLSSADELKEELIATALPALTENVVEPFTCWSEKSTNNNIHPDVFYSATGCLRNLSSGRKKDRKAMRDCSGLINSLMSYIQSCVAEDNPDDKSVENCACILHNLSYQLEEESPGCYSKFQPAGRKSSTVGCFSPKSSKAQKEISLDAVRGMPEESTPTGVNWLCHPKAMQTYMSLLGSSQKDGTLEACCGALQNLTALKGAGSSSMSQLMVQKLGALMHLRPLLKSSNPGLQKTAMSLLGNMSRTSSLQTSMAKQILPDITSLLSSSPKEMGNSDDTITSACNTARNLMFADSEVSKKFVDNDLVSAMTELSKNTSFPKGSRSASMLLYTLWSDKNLQGVVRKLGLDKSMFVNDYTTSVHKSMQLSE